MSDNETRHAIVLAALLHDIGKFRQRASFEEDRGKSHVRIGYEWLLSQYGEGIIAAGARNHHGNEPETWETNLSLILYEADNCAASERGTRFDPDADAAAKWQREIQLANVFSRVQPPNPVDGGEAPPASFHALKPIGEWIPPLIGEQRNSATEYRVLWQGFESEFSILRGFGNHRNVDAVAHLLEKYTSFVPSITLKIYGESDAATYKKHPDISLFDHLKITAAASACLHDFHRHHAAERWHREVLKDEIAGDDTWASDTPTFMLVGGDISGVQRFIYTISSKGALKALKGRSFFLELFTEHTVDRLLEELGLTRCNVIFTGGGHFYLLAPNVPGTRDAVEKVKKELNDYLFDAFNGSLQQFIEAVPFGKKGFKDTAPVWQRLSAELENAKLRKWDDRLDALFRKSEMPHSTCLVEDCQVCGREDKPLVQPFREEADFKVCEPCSDQVKLGSWLQRSVGSGGRVLIVRWDEKPKDAECVEIAGRYYEIKSWKGRRSSGEVSASASAVFHLNDWELANFVYPSSRPLLAGVYLPRSEAWQDLEGMARNGFGMSRLAVLRMDVDYLGRIFSTCIPEGERILSRMASLSRQLSLFFKYHLNGLLQRREGYPAPFMVVERAGERRLGVVYSGGDDLFLIGQWLDATEAAFEINHAFQRFTANPFITISGGLSLGDVHEPVYRMAEAGGEALDLAKSRGRRSVTLFGTHAFPWSEAGDGLLEAMKTIGAFSQPQDDHLRIPEGSISKAFLYRLLFIARKHRQEDAWIMPRLAYLFGRFRPRDQYAQPWGELKDYVFSKKANWHHLEVAILWTLMMMRKGGAE